MDEEPVSRIRTNAERDFADDCARRTDRIGCRRYAAQVAEIGGGEANGFRGRDEPDRGK